MANDPLIPGGVARGVVRPANNEPGGARANNGYLALQRVNGDVAAPNRTGGDRRGGTADLAGQASPVQPPNHRFDVGTARMSQPPSAVEPGQGAVPVNPWDAMGRPNRAATEPDMATPRQPPRPPK